MRRLAVAAGLVLLLVTTGCTASDDSGTAQRSPAPSVTASGLAWRALAASPSARTEVAATVAGMRVYVIGGYEADGGTLTTVEIFDTVAGTWRNGPALPVPVNHSMAATVGGNVYVFGGNRPDGTPDAAAFRLDLSGSPLAWRTIAALPQPRGAGTAVAIGNQVYIAGGVAPGGLASEMLVYDAPADRWSTTAGPPTRREHLGGAGFGSMVYTVGGRTAGADTNLDAFEAFDTGTGQWRRLPSLPTRRGGLAATATCSGHIVAVGGEAAKTFSEAEVFDVRAGTWRSLPPVPTPRHGLGVVALGTIVYTFAGGPKPGLFVADTAEAIDLAALGACP
jgi:hypothetical protein